MSRQDANAAFALTSFLDGGNAAYIEDLYARYLANPGAVDAEWQAFFQSLKDGRAEVGQGRLRPVLAAAELAAAPAATTGRRAHRRLGRGREGGRRQDQGQGAGARASNSPPTDVQQATRDSIHALMLIRAYRARGHFHANLDPLGLEPREERGGARSALLRLHRSRHGPPDLPRQGARPRIRDAARDRRDPAAHLLPDARRRVHAHLRSRRRRPGCRSASKGRTRRSASRREGRRAILNKLIEAEGFENFCDLKFTGTKRFGLDGGEVDDPGAGADHQARRRARREGDRHRHGASRPAQRAGAGDGQAAPRDLPRVQGRLGDAERRRRLRRREVSPRRVVGPRVRRQQGASLADRQSVASRDRGAGRARQGARQAGLLRRDPRGPHHGDAAPDPRRRVVRRAGRDRGMLRPLRPARPPHRRLRAFHRQQPDRLHHLSALLALVAVSVRRRQDDRGADLPCERRRSRGGGLSPPRSRPSSGRSSRRRSSSTCSATGASATTRATSRRSPSR